MNKHRLPEIESTEHVSKKKKRITISEVSYEKEEIEFHRQHLQHKHSLYCKILSQTEPNIAFWDLVVVTAADKDQKAYYETQLNERLQRNEIPKQTRYLVIADPPGPKIGSGGATFYVLDFLHNNIPKKEIESGKTNRKIHKRQFANCCCCHLFLHF